MAITTLITSVMMNNSNVANSGIEYIVDPLILGNYHVGTWVYMGVLQGYCCILGC